MIHLYDYQQQALDARARRRGCGRVRQRFLERGEVMATQKQLDEALDEIAGLEDALAHVLAVEQDGAHIVIEWREIGGIRIGLDAAGSAVRVEFGDTLPGWVAE